VTPPAPGPPPSPPPRPAQPVTPATPATPWADGYRQAAPYWGPPPGAPPYAAAPPTEPLDAASELRAAGITASIVLLLGAPLGLLWGALRPAIDTGAAATQESLFDAAMTADVRLLLLGLALGVVAGALGWVFGRRRAVGVAAGIAVGGVLAMLLAAQVGRLAAHPDRLRAQVTRQFADHGYDFAKVDPRDQKVFLDQVRFENRAYPVAAGLPVAGCAVLALLLLTTEPEPRRAAQPPPFGVPVAG